MEVMVVVLLIVVLVLLIHGAIQAESDDAANQVARWDQPSADFLPPSYDYLNDLGEWIRKNKRDAWWEEEGQ